MWLQLKQTLQFQLCDVPDLVLLWEKPCVLLLLMKCLPFLAFLHVLGRIGHVISSSFYNSTPTVVLLRYFFPSFSPNKWHQFSCWSATALWSAAVLFLAILDSEGCAKEGMFFSLFPFCFHMGVVFSGALKQECTVLMSK